MVSDMVNERSLYEKYVNPQRLGPKAGCFRGSRGQNGEWVLSLSQSRRAAFVKPQTVGTISYARSAALVLGLDAT